MAVSRQGLRARWLARVAETSVARSTIVLVVLAVVTALAGVYALGLGVSTSRQGLVADDDPVESRLRAFHAEFGRPDAMVLVVSGPDAAARRAAVDALEGELGSEPELDGRVLGRVTAPRIAPVLLLQQPGALAQLRQSLPPATDLAELVEAGVPGWLQAATAQIEAGLDGADPEAADATTRGDALAQADEGLARLAELAGVLDDVLAGRDPMDRLAPQASQGLAQGIDERGYFVSADGRHHLVTVFAQLDSDEGRVVAPIVERIRATRDHVLADMPGVTADLTGMPALNVDERAIVSQGLAVASAVTTVGITLLCLLLFRSLLQTVVALLPLLPGTLLTLAAVRLLFDDLNVVTSAFVAVLLGLGIDFPVHALSRYNEARRGGTAVGAAIVESLRATGPGIATGGVVTAAAFLTTATTDYAAFAELGYITALGMGVMLAAVFWLLPALLARTKAHAAPPPEPPGLSSLPRLLRAAPRPIVVVAVLGAIAGAAALPGIRFNSRYFDFLPEDTEAARGLESLEYDPIASPVFANFAADSIEEAREMTQALREHDSVAGVVTPTDLLPPLPPERLAALRADFAGIARDPDFGKLAAQATTPQALARAATDLADALEEARAALRSAGRDVASADAAVEAVRQVAERARTLDADGAARLASLSSQAAALLEPAWTTARGVAGRGAYLPSDVPAAFAHRFVSRSGERVALFAIPAGQFWEVEVAERFAAHAAAVDPDVSGLAMIHVAHGQIVLAGFLRAAALAAVIVFVLVVADFRSGRDALWALAPTVLGWSWMLGVMALLGLSFDVANIVCLPLVLGIGIAFGVHVMHRCREEREAGSQTAPASLDRVLRGTGGAVAVSALTTIVGFAGLLVASYGGMRSVGGVMVIGIFACLIATVFVLPAGLVWARRLR